MNVKFNPMCCVSHLYESKFISPGSAMNLPYELFRWCSVMASWILVDFKKKSERWQLALAARLTHLVSDCVTDCLTELTSKLICISSLRENGISLMNQLQQQFCLVYNCERKRRKRQLGSYNSTDKKKRLSKIETQRIQNQKSKNEILII